MLFILFCFKNKTINLIIRGLYTRAKICANLLSDKLQINHFSKLLEVYQFDILNYCSSNLNECKLSKILFGDHFIDKWINDNNRIYNKNNGCNNIHAYNDRTLVINTSENTNYSCDLINEIANLHELNHWFRCFYQLHVFYI